MKAGTCSKCGQVLTNQNTQHTWGRGKCNWCDTCHIKFWAIRHGRAGVKVPQSNGFDFSTAKSNRERVASGESDPYFLEQAHKIAQWVLGEIVPHDVAYNECPHGSIKYILQEVA